MSDQPSAPEPENRPKFWRYIRERGLSKFAVGQVFGYSDEWVRLICLPFEDAKRRTPSPADIERIFLWTSGAVGPADWYPPRLSVPADLSSQPEGSPA